MRKALLAALSAALLSASGAKAGDPLDFATATIVSASSATPLETKAVQVLQEEIEERTGHTLRASSRWPADPRPLIVVGTRESLSGLHPSLAFLTEAPRPGAEGYTVVARSQTPPVAVVAGEDPRGVLYGVGHLSSRKTTVAEVWLMRGKETETQTQTELPVSPLAGGPRTPSGATVSVSETHPQYWSLGGRTTLLLGGSREDNLFQISDLEQHLDALVAAGGNYVRCTLSSRDPGNAWPFLFDEGQGLYDLDRWNEVYWKRLERFLEETSRRGIVVQIELWATFDFYREPWDRNPFNPKNNGNYTAERTGLPTEVATHPTRTRNRFFWSIPDHDNNAPVLAYQQRFVDRLLAHTLRYEHVLYCMDNETSVTAAWGRFWAGYVRKRAAESGRTVHTTEMWDPWDLSHVMHRETFDHPELYDFVDISQNNHQRGQAHWDNGLGLLQRLEHAGRLRPVNNVKTYGADGGRHGGDTDEGVAKLVRSVFFGSAAARFHRPPSGLGLGEAARPALRGLRELSDRMPWFDAAPHNDLLGDREENEAYCRALPGSAYAVYFPDGGSVTLDTSALEAPAALLWLDLREAVWSAPEHRAPGEAVRLEPSEPGHRVALVLSEEALATPPP